MLLAAAGGKCIRFPATAVRLFSGRSSTGVRGIKLAQGDRVISMSVLHHVEFEIEERDAYLKQSRAERAEDGGENSNGNGNDNGNGTVELDAERYAEMAAQDQRILTIADNGYGKRTSAYEYRVSGRGGQGITNIELTKGKNVAVVASFPVIAGDQLVLVTDAGQLTRTTVNDIRIAGRSTRGVIVFRVAEDEKVVSVTRMSEEEGTAGQQTGGANGANGADGANGAGQPDAGDAGISDADMDEEDAAND